ncbi:MAG: RecQ family zinc-binding domain-containing protein, partial [Bacteroidales bacterium]|nr:RecQ family zinc-binding domain-containing protein [Bacteroidales bacterium]
ALVSLVENDAECRCLQMYRYFGQEGGRPCGRCDVCARTK